MSESKTSFVIICGPLASGKTINAEALRKHYKCDHVFDEGFHNPKILAAGGRVMILTSDPDLKGPRRHRKLYKGAMIVPLAEARHALGSLWRGPEVLGKDRYPTFEVPSEFMRVQVIPEEIKQMSCLEIAQRLRHEQDANGLINWDDDKPETCWFRALAVNLGSRIYAKLEPDFAGDWKDDLGCLLPGIAGYQDNEGFKSEGFFEIDDAAWDALEDWLEAANL